MRYFFGDRSNNKDDKDEEFAIDAGDLSMQKHKDDEDDDDSGGINNLLNDLEVEEQSLLKKSKEKLEQKLDQKITQYSEPNYTMLFLFAAIGCFFLFASLTSLPFLLLAPRGFILYFSLAQMCFLISVSFYYGPCVYLKTLICSRSNAPISLIYISCTVANIYFSFFAKIGYLYTLGMIVLQALAVFFFIYQAWSGGDNAQEKL